VKEERLFQDKLCLSICGVALPVIVHRIALLRGGGVDYWYTFYQKDYDAIAIQQISEILELKFPVVYFVTLQFSMKQLSFPFQGSSFVY
jgi:hypothetical protein